MSFHEDFREPSSRRSVALQVEDPFRRDKLEQEFVAYRFEDYTHDSGNPSQYDLSGPGALRRVSAPIPWTVYTVAFVDLCERLSYSGTQILYSNFVNHPLPLPSPNGPPGSNHNTGAGGGSPQGISGALGKGTQVANALITFNTFWCYLVPLLSAYVADEYLGRYKTICWAILWAIFGHTILVISAIPPVITNTKTCFPVFVLGMIVMGFGTGGFKPIISPLIVEQIPVVRPELSTLASGERVILDPIITQSRIYHYLYLFVNLGAPVGTISMAYAEKYVGFWLAFLLPTTMFLTTPLVMWWGRNRYIKAKPESSVTSKAVRVLCLALKNRWSWSPVKLWKRTHDGTLWKTVRPSNIHPRDRPHWMTFDDAWVDEIRRGLSACLVFCVMPIYCLGWNQLASNLIAQAGTMTLHGVPNDILSNINALTLLVFIPICDICLYPFLRRVGIRFTALRKIFLGFVFVSLAMAWAAVVQHYIYKTSPCGYRANHCFHADGSVNPSPMSVWYQTGSYCLLAFSEIFTVITVLEYSYSKAPRNMRSLVQALSFLSNAVSAAIAEALSPLSKDPLLVWNYGIFSVLCGLSGLLFMWQFWGLDKEEEKLNSLPAGHIVAEPQAESRVVQVC